MTTKHFASQGDVSRALAFVKDNPTMPLREAARTLGIGKSTLNDWVRRGGERQIGSKPLLTAAQEAELKARVFQLNDGGVPVSRKIIRLLVCQACSLRSLFVGYCDLRVK
jgi:hypothetical protein